MKSAQNDIYGRSWIRVIILVLLAWSFCLRFYALDSQSYWMDESFSLVLADTITQNGYPHHPDIDTTLILHHFKKSLGLRGPVYHYMLAAVIKLFGLNAYTVRGLSALLGVCFIGLLGKISWVWFDRQTAILTMLLATVNYWQIAWSRQARDYMLLSFFFWLAMYLMERSVLAWSNNNKIILGAFSATLVTMGIHPVGFLLLPAAALIILLKRLRHFSPILIISLTGVATLGMAGIGIFFVKKFFGIGPSYFLHYTAFLVREYWPLLLLAPLVLLTEKNDTSRPLLLWLFLVFFCGLLIISNGIPLLAYRYIFFLTPVIFLFAGRGLCCLFHRNVIIAATALLLLLTVQIYNGRAVIFPQQKYLLESDSKTSSFPYKCFTPQPNFKAAYAYINTLKNINLITPYPTISRLYRSDPDILAIHVRLKDYPGTDTPKRERYTGTPFLTFPAFTFLRKSDYDVYFLIDFFASTRMDPLLKKLIEENSTIIKTWDQPEWSKLILYKLNTQGQD